MKPDNRLLIPSIADIIFLSLFLYLSLSAAGQGLLNDCDTGYHIRTGEFILGTHAIPRQDIFSYITPPIPWTAHEWLSEIIMAIVHRFSGLTGVVVFFSALIALTYSLLYKTIRAGRGNLLVALTFTLLAAASSQLHWLARPHIFSLVLMVIWYHLLDNHQYRDRNRLFLLPLLMLLWVNLHGGYVSGFIILGVYLLGNITKAVGATGSEKERYRVNIRRLAVTTLCCLLAALINPVGYHILLFPFNVVSNRYLMDNVVEFVSPNFHEPLPFKYLLFLMIVVISVARKRLNFIELALILFFFNMALYSVRYITLFSIIAAPILARQADSFIDGTTGSFAGRLKRRLEGITSIDASLRGYFWPAAGILAAYFSVANGTIHYAFDATVKPVAAMEFLRKEPITGNMFDNDEFGDYLIYAGWPRYKVFFDGRSDMYGTERLKEYFKIARFEAGWEKTIDKYGITWIIYDANTVFSRFLLKNDNWRLIYADKVANIFVKNIPMNYPLIEKYRDVQPSSATSVREPAGTPGRQ